jgi:hypothetical protein
MSKNSKGEDVAGRLALAGLTGGLSEAIRLGISVADGKGSKRPPKFRPPMIHGHGKKDGTRLGYVHLAERIRAAKANDPA